MAGNTSKRYPAELKQSAPMASVWRERGANWLTALTYMDVLAAGLLATNSAMRGVRVA